jgi:hypothetical protein
MKRPYPVDVEQSFGQKFRVYRVGVVDLTMIHLSTSL